MTTSIKAKLGNGGTNEHLQLNQYVNVHSHNKFLRKYVEKLLKYRIMFKDIPTLLGFDYRITSLLMLYFVFMGISIPKIRSIE